MEQLNLLIIFVLIVIVAVLAYTVCTCGKQKQQKQQEGFVLTPQPVRMSPAGAIVGPGIMTNQMTRMPLAELTKQVNSNGYVTDGGISIGVGVGDGFDKLYTSQLEVQAIDDKAVGGYQQRSDLSEISQKIGASTSNANNNIFTRAGSTPTKLYIAPNEVRCVIDEKYLPERDKNRQVATVGTIIPTQGYDLNIERIGEALTDTHFSTFSCNAKRIRIPTAAGATATKGGESANTKVVNEQVEIAGDNIKINDTVARADVTTPMETEETKTEVPANVTATTPTETFRINYVRNY